VCFEQDVAADLSAKGIDNISIENKNPLSV
jgi:hypothetical protein